MKIQKSVTSLFGKGVLTIHELYVYKLLKFLFRSLAKLRASDHLNNLFEFIVYNRNTRSPKKGLKKIPLARSNMQNFSIKYRKSKLFSLLQENNLVPLELQRLNEAQFLKVIHPLKDLFILDNMLSTFIFT